MSVATYEPDVISFLSSRYFTEPPLHCPLLPPWANLTCDMQHIVRHVRTYVWTPPLLSPGCDSPLLAMQPRVCAVGSFMRLYIDLSPCSSFGLHAFHAPASPHPPPLSLLRGVANFPMLLLLANVWHGRQIWRFYLVLLLNGLGLSVIPESIAEVICFSIP